MSLDIEGVLEQHGALGYDDIDGCECGADVRSHDAHVAHVAAVLREQIAAAIAEAWDEGWVARANTRMPFLSAVHLDGNPYRAAPPSRVPGEGS